MVHWVLSSSSSLAYPSSPLLCHVLLPVILILRPPLPAFSAPVALPCKIGQLPEIQCPELQESASTRPWSSVKQFEALFETVRHLQHLLPGSDVLMPQTFALEPASIGRICMCSLAPSMPAPRSFSRKVRGFPISTLTSPHQVVCRSGECDDPVGSH